MVNEERNVFENNVRNLIARSKDVHYAQFLTQLLYKYRQNQVTKEYVMAEINRTYPMYLQRTGQSVQNAPISSGAVARTVAPAGVSKPTQPSAPKEKKDMEFAVGAGVLGVIGALFILIAFVMLGIAYMNGFVKGMMLYGIAAVVLLVSELIVAKKMPRFSSVLSGIGVSGLFLSTIINMVYLGNFGPWIGAVICAGIFTMALFLGKKKESGALHIINFVGSYLCAFPIWQAVSDAWGDGPIFKKTVSMSFPLTVSFIVIVVIIFAINLFTVFMSAKKSNSVVHILHQCANAVLTIAFAINVMASGVDVWLTLVFVSAALLMQGVNLKCFGHTREKQGISNEQTGANITYIVTTILMLVLFVMLSLFAEYDLWLHIAVGVLVAVEIIMFVLFKRNWMKWVSYESVCFTILALYGLMAGRTGYSYDIAIWITIAVFLLTKILARSKTLHISDIIITVIMAGWTLFSFAQSNLIYALFLFGAFVFGLFLEKNRKSLYEELLLALICGFVLINFLNELTPVILVCVFIAGFFGFNTIPYFRDKYTKVFNYINLGFLALLYIVAPFVVSDIAMLILFVLGCAFMIFAFKEKYGMNFKIKSIIFVLFLCYMILVWNISFRVIKCILPMVVAVAAVVAGFIRKERKLRISGLILSLLVCGKLLLYDFPGAASFEKMILFFVTGIIVLTIPGVYIALEKKMM